MTDRPNDAIRMAFERLREAGARGTPCAPIRDLIAHDDVNSAYQVQRLGIADRTGRGAGVIGRKIGLTSTAVQKQLGVDRPDFGVLVDDMGYSDGGEIPVSRFLQPRVEAEVAFVLGAGLADGDLELGQIRESVEYATAALEICDSRIAGWDIGFADTVADNASAGAFVLGTTRLPLSAFEPGEVEMSMTVSGQEPSRGNGAACLGSPLIALQWLARQARELGEPLRAGQTILSGALGPMRPVSPGDSVRATISDLGTVSCRFSAR